MKRFIVVVLLLFCVASCFWQSSTHRLYTIARSNKLEGINLHGEETSIQGFVEDLFFAIAKRKKFQIKFNIVENASTGVLLQKQGVDGVVGFIEETHTNQRLYVVSEPIFTFGPMLVIRTQDAYKNLDELKNKVVGFDRAYAGFTEGGANMSIIMQPYDQMTFAMEDLINGKIDACVLDSIHAYQLANSFYANKVKVVNPPLKEAELVLIAKRGPEEAFIKLFNEGINELKSEGTYKKMLDYWGLVDPSLE